MKKILLLITLFFALHLAKAQVNEPDVIKVSLPFENTTNGFGGKVVIRYTFRNCLGDVSILMSQYNEESSFDYYYYKGKKYTPSELDLNEFDFNYQCPVDVDGKIMRKGSPNSVMTDFIMTTLIADFGGCFNTTYVFNEFLTDEDKKEIVADETALNRFTLENLNLKLEPICLKDYEIEKLIEKKFNPSGENPNNRFTEQVDQFSKKEISYEDNITEEYFKVDYSTNINARETPINHSSTFTLRNEGDNIIPSNSFSIKTDLDIKFINDLPVIKTKTKLKWENISWAFPDNFFGELSHLQFKEPDLYKLWMSIKPEYIIIDIETIINSHKIRKMSGKMNNVTMRILIEDLGAADEIVESAYIAKEYEDLIDNWKNFEDQCTTNPDLQAFINNIGYGEVYPHNPRNRYQITGPSTLYTHYCGETKTPNLKYFLPRQKDGIAFFQSQKIVEIKWPWQEIEFIINEYQRRQEERELIAQKKLAEKNEASFWDTTEPVFENTFTSKYQKVDYSSHFNLKSKFDLVKLRKQHSISDLLAYQPSIQISNFGTVKDIDGNVYKTYRFGTKVWMIENLKTEHDIQGHKIDDVFKVINPSRFEYDINTMDKNEACPIGWSIPSLEDYNTLLKTLKIGHSVNYYAWYGDTNMVDLELLRIFTSNLNFAKFWIKGDVFKGKEYKYKPKEKNSLYIDYSHDAFESGPVFDFRNSLLFPEYYHNTNYYGRVTSASIRCIKK